MSGSLAVRGWWNPALFGYIARQALAHDIVLSPGNVFSQSRSASGFLRFNVAQSSERRLFTTLETIVRAPVSSKQIGPPE